MADDKITKLFVVEEKDYGSDYKNHLFEQYKLYIESIEKTSDRRHQSNNYFIAINTALISLIGLSFQISTFENCVWFRILLSVLGIFICAIFYYLVRAYKQLNTGKFAVLHKIEEKLPLALYKYEWDILEKGKDKKTYYPFSHIELLIPQIFSFLYLFLEVYFILSLFI